MQMEASHKTGASGRTESEIGSGVSFSSAVVNALESELETKIKPELLEQHCNFAREAITALSDQWGEKLDLISLMRIRGSVLKFALDSGWLLKLEKSVSEDKQEAGVFTEQFVEKLLEEKQKLSLNLMESSWGYMDYQLAVTSATENGELEGVYHLNPDNMALHKEQSLTLGGLLATQPSVILFMGMFSSCPWPKS